MDRLNEKVVRAVREYKQWSPAELRRIDEITVEVLEHCRNGGGNNFIRRWVDENLRGIFPRCPKCGNTENLETDQSVADYSCEACEITWRV